MKKFDLDNQPKLRSGFKAPDAYFEHFSVDVLQKLQDPERKAIPFRTKKNSWMYAAAAILVVSISIPIYNFLIIPTPELDQATLENYLSYHGRMSDRDFAELLDEKDLDQIDISSNIESSAIEDLLSTNANLETYLIN